jgi:hypothetical protein
MSLFFTKHALDKLDILARHHVSVNKSQVEEAVGAPDSVDEARAPLVFVEKALNPTHALRVAYRQENEVKSILTFYPVKRKNNDE